MSPESPPARKPKSGALPKSTTTDETPVRARAVRLIDGVSFLAFLGLTFLLGVFPLKDTDFWWHLRTGDWIREHGWVPRTDLYTFTVPEHAWIDLHWIYQVLLSWGYGLGGVVGLNLAKCAINVVAVGLLITARRRTWPLWPMLLAWIPALLVLGGRMYVRPETLSLLYLSMFLAILFRWERYPRLAWLLPVVELAWVNTQGLFILGPIVLAFALVEAAVRPGAFAPSQRRFWQTILGAAIVTGLVCLINPYGLRGALYPLELAGTMANPVFAASIAELTPIPVFIQRAGWANLPLLMHLTTMALGALSFIVPIVWAVSVRLGPQSVPEPDPASSSKKASKRSKKKAEASAPPERGLRPSVFRLLLFAFFSLLSMRATRNSHQFAAVVGTVTAWNFGEWAAARRALERPGGAVEPRLLPRLAALAAIVGVFVLVATGGYYALTGEGRTLGLGEERLWYPHEAMKFAGRAGMPERFIGFHDGYAALFEYYNGPERKVFADARLEVIGADLYQRYLELQNRIGFNLPGWDRSLDELGRPTILAGHLHNSHVGASLLANSSWRCVWFDPIAAVYLHASDADRLELQSVDFGARHFRPELSTDPQGLAPLAASALALRNYVQFLHAIGQGGKSGPLVLLGLDYARRAEEADPRGPDGWRLLGQLEALREAPPASPVPRYRLPFDPVFDLSAVRATYALHRALEIAPGEFTTLLMLADTYGRRGMNEAALPLLERVNRLRPINPDQRQKQQETAGLARRLRGSLGPMPPSSWENLSELDQIVSDLLASGRAESAANYLDRAYPGEPRPWNISDRLATLYLHLGDPARARACWELAAAPPSPAVREARLAVTHLVEGDFDAARRGFRAALAADPNLFEARYALAVLEQDAGRAAEALAEGRKAVALAPTDVARAAAQEIVANVTPYTDSAIARAGGSRVPRQPAGPSPAIAQIPSGTRSATQSARAAF